MGHHQIRHHHHHQHRPTYIQDSPTYNSEVKRSSSGSGSGPRCTPGHDTPGCTYPTNSSATLPIVLGVIIPLSAALAALFYLHRRNKKRQRIEDANDKHASLDFGLGEVSRNGKAPRGKKNKRAKPEMMDLEAERQFRLGRGMSMDMGSPYVLPGELEDSRPSFHSLSRSNFDSHDPYSPVAMVRSGASSPNLGPSRTQSRKDSASVWTESSDGTSRNLLRPTQNTTPLLNSPMANYELTASDAPDTPEIYSSTEPPQHSNSLSRKPIGGHHEPENEPEPEPHYTYDNIEEHEEPVARDVSDNQPPLPPLPPAPPRLSFPDEPSRNFEFDIPHNTYQDSPSIQVTASEDDRAPDHQHQVSYGSYHQQSNPSGFHEESPFASDKRQTPSIGPVDEYATYADVLGIVQKESSNAELIAEAEQVHGLGVYGFEQDNRRFSSSLRPLPPDDPSDNPEARANRIRSFYREYFDESKTAGGGYDGVDYYEDYGQEYLNEATVYDPETGQFIVGNNAPYAEPITRRAMTPPPRAPPRFGGPGGGHRHFGSDQVGGSRARGFSTASGHRPRPRGPKRPIAPPSPLTNLPTPYLLKDDAAIFTATDFAPPSSYRDRAAGRPESPFAEQRPYSPSVRAFTPLASPFDELSAMPSPHHLRKSGTFTALDFAPPPRLKADGASDNGSIRSGRSNMSATQLANIRAGAYRVSRIPKEYVGTKDEFAAALRPTWEQRGPTR